MSTTSDPPNDSEQQHSHLKEVRQKLLDVIEYVEDPDLLERISDWIERSYDTPAGSVEDHVQTRFSELESEYGMAVLEEGGKAKENFPDECSDCEHYGGACPMLHDDFALSGMGMIASDADDDSEYARQVRDLGRDFGCHRVSEFVNEFFEGDGELVAEGVQLVSETNMQTVDSETDEPTPRVNPDEVSDAGGESGGER